jgi:mono/diheme cytochrome c family protein
MWRLLTTLSCVAFGAAAADTKTAGQLFLEKCSVCHGADASGTDRGPALAGNRKLRSQAATDIAMTIRN